MHLSCILTTAIWTLLIHQVPVTALVGSDAALTGVMSLEFLHLVGADRSVIDQYRFLRGNDVSEEDDEERGFSTEDAKAFITKLVKMKTISDLWKVDDLTKLDKILDAAGDHMESKFRFAQRNKLGADDLANELKNFPELDESFRARVVELYSNYLKSG
ncbi:RxLR effector protein [Phytophthora megakarya]|uniref:RxLR effector protein n=1 Tax=Phytophthora megakarya TaxID=4795 RepID=A0A225VGG9_9STRA|nr:RxLR effector protein [Phytophthora megakarya]